jgi:hypothetical protein
MQTGLHRTNKLKLEATLLGAYAIHEEQQSTICIHTTHTKQPTQIRDNKRNQDIA